MTDIAHNTFSYLWALHKPSSTLCHFNANIMLFFLQFLVYTEAYITGTYKTGTLHVFSFGITT